MKNTLQLSLVKNHVFMIPQRSEGLSLCPDGVFEYPEFPDNGEIQ